MRVLFWALRTRAASAVFCASFVFALGLSIPSKSAAESPPKPVIGVEFLESLFEHWSMLHEARGGDAHVGVLLSELKAFRKKSSSAVGAAHLNLVTGAVAIQVADGDLGARDVWLVDNHRRSSVLPDESDKFLYVGRMDSIANTDQYALEVDLTPAQLKHFSIDLVVVTENDVGCPSRDIHWRAVWRGLRLEP